MPLLYEISQTPVPAGEFPGSLEERPHVGSSDKKLEKGFQVFISHP